MKLDEIHAIAQEKQAAVKMMVTLEFLEAMITIRGTGKDHT
jgi:hypothetical protein